MRVKITVTDKIIKQAYKTDNYRCPIGLALQEHGFYNNNVCYDGTIDAFDDKDDSYYKCFNPSLKLQRFITKFDEGKKVSPDTFVITLWKV